MVPLTKKNILPIHALNSCPQMQALIRHHFQTFDFEPEPARQTPSPS